MSVNNHDAVMDAIAASLSAYLPARHVQRSLIDSGNAPRAQLLAGLICVVSGGGGGFANYRGREGDLGRMTVNLVCFVAVAENTKPADVERAELAVLGDFLSWISTTAVPGVDAIYPGDWKQSQQLEHPCGWLVLALDVKT